MTLIDIKGRCGPFEYGKAGPQRWLVRDRRTNKVVPTAYPLTQYNHASSLAHRLYDEDRTTSQQRQCHTGERDNEHTA